jgi:hypothetical protein
MIRVTAAAEPAHFDAQVRQRGLQWLANNPTAKRPRDYWKHCLTDLADAFARRCAYAAMLDPTGGTVDHYLSFNTHPQLAYEWTNYRYASSTLNSSKQTADDLILDPFEVEQGWFEILLPSLQMRVTDAVPQAYRARAHYTLKRLNLRDGERIIRWRESWYKPYREKEISLEFLRRVAPLIADAVEREAAQQ